MNDSPIVKSLGVVLASLFVSSASAAQQATAADPPAPPTSQRTLGVVANAGYYSGIGGGVRLGGGGFALEAAGGWMPLLLVVQPSAEDIRNGHFAKLAFVSSWVADLDAEVLILKPMPATEFGAKVGYRYDSVLSHGVALGLYASIDLSRQLVGRVYGGVLVFPNGEAGARDAIGLSPSSQFSFPGPTLQGGLSFGLAFFPG